jgi:hypothetical protein
MPVLFAPPKWVTPTFAIDVVLNFMLLAKIPPSLPGPGRSGQFRGQFEGHLGPPLSKEKDAHVPFIVFYISEVWRKI